MEIRNIRTAAFCTNVRLLNQGDIKLHDIVIDGVYDMGRESVHMDSGIFAVRIGDTRLYGPRHSTEDETYNITVNGKYYPVFTLNSNKVKIENIQVNLLTGVPRKIILAALSG